MELVTFNIRCDYGQDGENCFAYRKEMILNKINSQKPDILCFQEVLPHVYEWLASSLSSYHVLGCGRDADLGGEQTTVAVRKERFQIISMDTFWLSETPHVPGSRYRDQSDCPRTVTELFVQEHSTGRLFLIFNTHLDHIGSQARVLGMGQILSSIRSSLDEKRCFGPVEAVLAGDFNAYPEDEEICLMGASGVVRDITETVGGTFHDFGRLLPATKIDYIAVTPGLSCENAYLWTDCENGIYLSDHYPVCAKLIPTV